MNDNKMVLTFDSAVVLRFFFCGVFKLFMALFALHLAFDVVSCTEEARLSLGGSCGGGGVVISTLECLGGGNGGGFASPSSSSSFLISSSMFFVSSSTPNTISKSSSYSSILPAGMIGRLIIEDLFLAGSGGGFLCPGVDGLDVEAVDDKLACPGDAAM